MHDHEQTIWVSPRATIFTEVCEVCEEEQADGLPWPTVHGSLELPDVDGWVTCPRGHTMRVLRMGRAMPAGALR